MSNKKEIARKALWCIALLAVLYFMVTGFFRLVLWSFEIITESRYNFVYMVTAGNLLVRVILGLLGSLWVGRHLFRKRVAIKCAGIAVLLFGPVFLFYLNNGALALAFRTPWLLREVSWDKTSNVRLLLRNGVDPNMKDKAGQTALIIASYADYLDIVELLLSHGARVDEKDNIIGITALMIAAFQGHVDVVQELIQRGADVNAKADDCATALMCATWNGHTETVKALLANGAEVNAKDNTGRTALMNAAAGGHTEIVEDLLAEGANPNAKNNEGATVLMYAAAGNTETVEALLAKGADVNAKDNKGRTALMAAASRGHKDIVQLLKKAGAEE